MAKDVQLTVDGTATTYSGVQTIVTGSRRWMPEDEATYGRLYATDNGEYEPTDTYGYDRVSVLVPGGGEAEVEVLEDGEYVIKTVDPGPAPIGEYGGGSIVGISTEDNEYHYIYVDSDGVTHDVVIPARAEVTTQPTTTAYSVGDTIDWTGCEVTLYYMSGMPATEWDDGAIAQGTASWDVHIIEHTDELTETGTYDVPLYVRPFWFNDGLLMGTEYAIELAVSVTVA